MKPLKARPDVMKEPFSGKDRGGKGNGSVGTGVKSVGSGRGGTHEPPKNAPDHIHARPKTPVAEVNSSGSFHKLGC